MLLPQQLGPCWRFMCGEETRHGRCVLSLEMLKRSFVNNVMKDGPVGACFWWTKLLFFKFKLIYKQLLKNLVQDAVTI
jgi:hypothetical protein